MDIVTQVIFFLIAALIVGSAMMVVTVRNVIHAALWLVTSFTGVAMLYLLLEAEFLAFVQILIYVGAVSVLVLFAIMLTRQVTSPEGPVFYPRWWLSLIVAIGLFGGILVPTLGAVQFFAPETQPGVPAPTIGGTVEIGTAFVQAYLLPFQVAAILLMVALIGAIVVAYEESARHRRVLTLAERHAMQQRERAAADADSAPEPATQEPEPQAQEQDDDDGAVIRNIPR